MTEINGDKTFNIKPCNDHEKLQPVCNKHGEITTSVKSQIQTHQQPTKYITQDIQSPVIFFQCISLVTATI